MPWNGSAPSQTAGRTDGTRSGSTTWQLADAASVDIIAPDHDTHDQDICDMVNSCLKKDGGNTAAANIPMGGFTFTNLAAASARTQPARFSDVQDGKGVYVPTVGGTANAITLTTGYSVDAYAAGQTFHFIAASSNSDAVTVAVDGLAAKSIKIGSTALALGQIVASTMITITYDGTQFQLSSLTTAPAAIAVGVIMAWPTSTVPTGWLECYGQAVSRTTYAALFAAIGTTYGSGDGSTTFNLPDMRGRAIFGEDDMGGSSANRLTGAVSGVVDGDVLGATGGFETTTIAQANLPAVTLSVSGNTSFNYVDGSTLVLNTSNDVSTSGGGTRGTSISFTNRTGLTGTTAALGSGTAINNMPPTIVLKWIILALPAAALAIGTGFTRSARLIHTGGLPARVSTDGTDTTPSVTETYIAEVFVPGPGSVTVTGISVFNGSAVAGNIKLALADSSGNIVASTASTAASGTDAYQRVALSTAYSAVGPATYFVLLQCNNTGQRFNSHTFGDFGASKKTGETYGTFTAITPPTTFTTALGPIASLY